MEDDYERQHDWQGYRAGSGAGTGSLLAALPAVSSGEAIAKESPPNRCVRCDDTNVVVSVSDCTERDLIKRFDEDIDYDTKSRDHASRATGTRFATAITEPLAAFA